MSGKLVIDTKTTGEPNTGILRTGTGRYYILEHQQHILLVRRPGAQVAALGVGSRGAPRRPSDSRRSSD